MMVKGEGYGGGVGTDGDLLDNKILCRLSGGKL